MGTPSLIDLVGAENSPELVKAALDYAESEMRGDVTGHDLYHVARVFRVAGHIAEAEGADLFHTALVAALHDVKDFKFTGDDMSGARASRDWLLMNGATDKLADSVAADVSGISFKGAGTPSRPLTLEGQCVQDADRLDALGAIGIARCFTYGGAAGRSIHDPAIAVAELNTTEAYLQNKGTSINHFYEKLLLLRDRMNTKEGIRIAERRHAFLEDYLAEFQVEWNSVV